jgi:chromosomal replication initiation ATPase DnaA
LNQLPLPFDHAPRFGLDDFMPSASNAVALGFVARWPDWPDGVLLLTGPEGSGKSHLARIWAARADAAVLTPEDLAGDLDALMRRNAVIEDADRSGVPEAALFHALNLVRERGLSLVVTARDAPPVWPIATPDLLSRLRLAPSVAIEPADDALMRAVLVKLFADRQLAVDAALVDYLATRLDRSLGAARQAVMALDRAGLDAGRRIGRSLAASLFGAPRADGDDGLRRHLPDTGAAET